MKTFSWRRVRDGVLFGILGMFLLMLALGARAGDATLTWVRPTAYCNGDPLTTLSKYDLLYGQKRSDVPQDATSFTVDGLSPGTWWFSLSAVDAAGVRGEVAVAEKVVAANAFVTKSVVVYTFARSNGNILVMGTTHRVPLGTVCDPSQSVNGKYKIPLEAITWSGPRLTAALADCG